MSAGEESEDYWNGVYGEDGYRRRLRELDQEAEERECLRSARNHRTPKYVFKWCSECKFVENCYPNGSGPNYLEPSCGKGPAL